MQTIQNELLVMCDVDLTLVRPSEKGSLLLPYGSKICRFEPILEHVELIKEYKNRGFTVFVWSMGGYRWAKTVTEALKLQDYVDFVCSKPCKFVDDKNDVGSILGTRVYLV